MALYIISNRLPLKVSRPDNEYVYERSEGGLATGLGSLQDFTEKKWIGWPGIFSDNEEEKEEIRVGLLPENFHPVFLSEDQIRDYYEGYSNSMIWPLCHYFYTYIQYETKFWESYQEVNQLFCDEAVKILKPGDMVWIQDYQLMLLPALLRDKVEGISIGYFHHIPFPSYELFRVLPERAEILKGLFGADLIGFHTHDYMRHFISAAYRVLGIDSDLDEIHYNDRVIHVDAFPMGINYDLHHDAILDKTVQKMAIQFRQNFGNHKLVLSVDRLDYSKGIIHRLKGFAQFLENNPEYRSEVSLVMVVVPSRDSVDRYADLKTKIDEMIGSLNGLYSTLYWSPVYYFYRGFPFEELMALYHIANFALVTPVRDGMNLVAKEYIAVKRDEPGMLILSEMAGAATELKEAIIINPNNIDEIEEALLEALKMPEEEKKTRMDMMRQTLSKQTVNKWANDFTTELAAIKEINISLQNKIIGIDSLKYIQKQYKKAMKRLIILDYDGTLVPIVKNPELAIPDKQLIETLKHLAADKQNHLVISSGRDAEFLDKYFSKLDLNLAAEHGAFFKEHGKWHENIRTNFPVDEEILDILQKTTDKTPGSRIEMKKTSISWHYRNCDKWLAELRKQQLVNTLMNPCTRLNLQIMRGNKVIELKMVGVDKGIEAVRLMNADNYDFVMAMGDDITDEDMFHTMPPEAITIKVGSISDHARFSLPQLDTVKFLSDLMFEKQ
jgi:trehalose 6-phosphate synthase/phosphatase